MTPVYFLPAQSIQLIFSLLQGKVACQEEWFRLLLAMWWVAVCPEITVIVFSGILFSVSLKQVFHNISMLFVVSVLLVPLPPFFFFLFYSFFIYICIYILQHESSTPWTIEMQYRDSASLLFVLHIMELYNSCYFSVHVCTEWACVLIFEMLHFDVSVYAH